MAYPDGVSGAAITAATDSRREVRIEPRALSALEASVIAHAHAVMAAVAAFKALALALDDVDSRRLTHAAVAQANVADALENAAEDLPALIEEIEAMPAREANAMRTAIEDAAWMAA